MVPMGGRAMTEAGFAALAERAAAALEAVGLPPDLAAAAILYRDQLVDRACRGCGTIGSEPSDAAWVEDTLCECCADGFPPGITACPPGAARIGTRLPAAHGA